MGSKCLTAPRIRNDILYIEHGVHSLLHLLAGNYCGVVIIALQLDDYSSVEVPCLVSHRAVIAAPADVSGCNVHACKGKLSALFSWDLAKVPALACLYLALP